MGSVTRSAGPRCAAVPQTPLEGVPEGAVLPTQAGLCRQTRSSRPCSLWQAQPGSHPWGLVLQRAPRRDPKQSQEKLPGRSDRQTEHLPKDALEVEADSAPCSPQPPRSGRPQRSSVNWTSPRPRPVAKARCLSQPTPAHSHRGRPSRLFKTHGRRCEPHGLPQPRSAWPHPRTSRRLWRSPLDAQPLAWRRTPTHPGESFPVHCRSPPSLRPPDGHQLRAGPATCRTQLLTSAVAVSRPAGHWATQQCQSRPCCQDTFCASVCATQWADHEASRPSLHNRAPNAAGGSPEGSVSSRSAPPDP